MSQNRYERSVEEVEETLKLAGISPAKVKKSTQVIYSNLKERADLDKNTKLMLVEIDDHLVSSIAEGQELVFKSGANGHVVLCSDSRTYDVKEAEMSNSLIIAENLKLLEEIKKKTDGGERTIDRVDITRIFHNYYELREARPKIGDLLSLLGPSAFKGVEYAKQVDKSSLYDWRRLQASVQMSDGELEKTLSEYLVAEIDGFYRLISFEYEAKALTMMLDFMEENSWQPDEVDKEETYEALVELIPRSVFELIFKRYAAESPRNKESSGGKILYEYNPEKVCQMLAKVLLAASPKNAYDKFMEAWKIGVPEQLRPQEKYLNGLAVIKYNKEKGRRDVVAFPESSLPEDIHQRLQEIFRVKDKWTVDEITPYLSRLTSKTANVTALLAKYARPSTFNGVRYYSSKHGK